MASELRVNTLKDASGNNSIATSFVAGGSAKAWVNFNGTGTIAARDSLNNSSLTDNGTGDYTVTMSSAMSDANYGMSGTAGKNANDGAFLTNPLGSYSNTTTAHRIRGLYQDGGALDMTMMSNDIKGDLA